MNTFERAGRYIYRNARPLDLARWQFHFENGSKEAVMHALSFYQNADGGFGHGLEADFLNPDSTPIATWAATQIIREIGLRDSHHPIVQGILRYLESGADFVHEQNQWLNTVPTNNDHPHAIWWEYNGVGELRYNPTAALAGFMIQYAVPGSALYKKGCEIARQAFAWFTQSVPFTEQHITGCFVTLYDCLEETGIDLVDMDMFKMKLLEQVKGNICRDVAKWAVEYVSRPSDFFLSRESMLYPDNAESAEAECEFILSSQLADGSFPVTWQWWTEYKEFEISINRWKSIITINNMRYLRSFGKR